MNAQVHVHPARLLLATFTLTALTGLLGCDGTNGAAAPIDLSALRMLRGHGDEIGSLDATAAAQPVDLTDYRRAVALRTVSIDRHDIH